MCHGMGFAYQAQEQPGQIEYCIPQRSQNESSHTTPRGQAASLPPPAFILPLKATTAGRRKYEIRKRRKNKSKVNRKISKWIIHWHVHLNQLSGFSKSISVAGNYCDDEMFYKAWDLKTIQTILTSKRATLKTFPVEEIATHFLELSVVITVRQRFQHRTPRRQVTLWRPSWGANTFPSTNLL